MRKQSEIQFALIYNHLIRCTLAAKHRHASCQLRFVFTFKTGKLNFSIFLIINFLRESNDWASNKCALSALTGAHQCKRVEFRENVRASQGKRKLFLRDNEVSVKRGATVTESTVSIEAWPFSTIWEQSISNNESFRKDPGK